jgi:ubiquinol-cytochrome c reductase cytochrome b subunit
MRLIEQIGEWFDRRLQLAAPIRETMDHPVPRNTASWFYVFGSAALTVFILQLVTGILLALIYVPSGAEAWSSLQALNHDIALGWFVRALHGWGSNFMVAIVLIHMVQVFLFGAYKFPRELTWIVGVFLLLMTLGMAFTGQVLRFDQDAYWGLGIGASIASRVPVMGPFIVKLMLGGPIIAGATLSRFFALHVFVIPGTLILLIAVHLLMVVKLGINEWPMPGRLVKRATYEAEYHALTEKDGAPFVPYAVWKDLFFAAFVLAAVAACAVYFGPFGPSGAPDPTVIQTAPQPDYFFLWLYALLSFLPPAMETPALLIGPVVVIAGLVLLPFLSGEGEKSWKRRPIAVLSVMFIAVTLGTLTHLAGYTPWSPHMNAWSGDPVPDKFLHGSTALQRRGALVFQVKQCRNCHSLGELGGQRGPTLDAVAVRLTQDQLIRQVIQGGGNMPAYGKNLSPAETTALVAFLETLHPAGQSPARDAARDAVLKESQEQSVPAQPVSAPGASTQPTPASTSPARP